MAERGVATAVPAAALSAATPKNVGSTTASASGAGKPAITVSTAAGSPMREARDSENVAPGSDARSTASYDHSTHTLEDFDIGSQLGRGKFGTGVCSCRGRVAAPQKIPPAVASYTQATRGH
jgi:hypothetical protein